MGLQLTTVVDELIRRRVLEANDVLNGAFRVEAVAGRNGACLVRTARSAILVKPVQDPAREVRGLARCAAPSAGVWAPRLRFASEEVVATETVSTLAPIVVSPRSGRHRRWVAAALGASLGHLHRLSLSGDEPTAGHLPFDPDGSNPTALNESPAVRALLVSYYDDSELVGAVRGLARQMLESRTAFIHGDVRAANVLADARTRRICLIDWELCGRGDPMIDLGAAIALLLADSLRHPRGSPDRSGVSDLLAAYRDANGPPRLEGALRCAGSSLLQFSLENASVHLQPSAFSRRASAVGRMALVTPALLALHLRLV